MNTSKMFTLNWGDVGKGLIVAVFSAIITSLLTVVQTPGFDFSQLDWRTLATVAFIATVSYLAKNFISDGNGKVLGKVG